MSKLIFTLIVLTIIIASWFTFDLSRYLPPDIIFTQGIKYESAEVQKQIAKALKKQKIPFRINNEGFIEYRKKDFNVVNEIATQIHITLSPEPKIEQPPPNISFSTVQMHNEFIRILESNEIPYRIKRRDPKDNEYVIWNKTDDEKVLKIIAQLEQKTSCNNSPPSISFPLKEQREHFTTLLKNHKIPFKIIEKAIEKGDEIFIEYDWKDYVIVNQLIRKTVSEVKIDSKT